MEVVVKIALARSKYVVGTMYMTSEVGGNMCVSEEFKWLLITFITGLFVVFLIAPSG